MKASRRSVVFAGLLLASFSHKQSPGEGYVEPSLIDGTNGFVIQGTNLAPRMGTAACAAGDMNGDGVEDFAVGSDGGSTVAMVFFGGVERAALETNPGVEGFIVDALGSGVVGPWSMAGAGDVNGDGFDDLLIGGNAAQDDPRTVAWLIFGGGALAGDTRQLATLDASEGVRLESRAQFNGRRTAVAALGDMNADGFSDIVIGNYGDDPGLAHEGRGAAYVVFGHGGAWLPNVNLRALDGTNGFSIAGAVGDQLGYDVNVASDFNGDGVQDIVLSSPSWSVSSVVVFGKRGVWPSHVDASSLSAADGTVLRGMHALGTAAADLNGDGLSDIILAGEGRYSAAYSFIVEKTSVVLGRDSAPAEIPSVNEPDVANGILVTSMGFQDGPVLGESAGDINGDGLEDVFFGAPFADSCRYIGSSYYCFSGAGYGTMMLGDATPGIESFAFFPSGIFSYKFVDGRFENNEGARSLAGIGDINGDGIADLATSIAGLPVSEGISGETYVIFGLYELPESTLYRATVAAGNAPRHGIGAWNQAAFPMSRMWVDYSDGSTASLDTVTLHRSSSAISGVPAPAAPAAWQWETTRADWTTATVTIHYLPHEVAGLTESTLRVYHSASPSGPWSDVTSGPVDEQRDRISAVVSSSGYLSVAGPVSGGSTPTPSPVVTPPWNDAAPTYTPSPTPNPFTPTPSPSSTPSPTVSPTPLMAEPAYIFSTGNVTIPEYSDELSCIIDFDDDGLPDIANGDFWPPRIHLLGNAGDSFFIPAGSFDIPAKPRFPTPADMDGDGDKDLVFIAYASFGEDSVLYVYANDGMGNFTQRSQRTIEFADGLAILDADADGDRDVALAYDAPERIACFRNNGDGSFGASTVTNVLSAAMLRSIDMDGDGDLDLVTRGSSGLFLFENKGSGSAGSGQLVESFQSTQDYAAGDVDGDGDMDFATLSLDRYVHVIRNNGTSFSSTMIDLSHTNARRISLVDYDNDGDGDIVVGVVSSGQFLLRNDGSGTFSPALDPPLYPLTFDHRLMELDVTGDGQFELLTIGADSLTIRDSASPGGFAGARPRHVVGNEPVLLGDFDIDGLADVIARFAYPENSGLSRNLGSSVLDTPVNFPSGAPRSVMAAVDLDEDGNLDLIANGELGKLLVLRSLGGGIFDSPKSIVVSASDLSFSPSLIVENMDGNSGREIMFALDDRILMYRNVGGVNYVGPHIIHASGVVNQFCAVDYDVDGDRDLALVAIGSSELRFLENDGSGAFTASETVALNEPALAVQAADMNGDGMMDVAIIGQNTDGQAAYFSALAIQDGFSPSLTESFQLRPGTGSHYQLRDFDGDGLTDVMYGGAILFNRGTLGFASGYSYDINPIQAGAIDENISIDALGYANPSAEILNNSVPILVETKVHDAHAVDVIFSLPVSEGQFDPSHYTISGSGKGTLADHPDFVTGSGEGTQYRLHWLAGEMVAGGDVVITVTRDIKDHLRNRVGYQLSATETGTAITPTPAVFTPSPTPSPSVTSSPSPTRTPSAAATPTPTVSPSPTPRPTPGEPATIHPIIFEGALHNWVTEGYVTSIASADFDNDGDTDLATTQSSDGVEVLLNDGNGVYVPRQFHASVGDSPQDISVSDFDRDGNIDFAVTMRYDDAIRVFIGVGDGTFSMGPQVYGGNDPGPIACGDINGDTYPDIVAGNIEPLPEGAPIRFHNFAIMMNDGSGGFAPTVLSQSVRAESLALADVDGDGDLDIGACDSLTTRVYIYKNDGGGNFPTGQNYNTANRPVSLSFGDADNDGDADLLTSSVFSKNISVLRNDGTGAFSARTDYAMTVGILQAIFVDLENDGDMDIATTGANGSEAQVLRNNGSGTFTPGETYAATSQTIGIHAIDTNNDGFMELLPWSGYYHIISELRNNGDGTFVKPAFTRAADTAAWGSDVADLNNDGFPDIAVTNPNAGSVSVYIANGYLDFKPKVDYTTASGAHAVTCEDIDGDGDVDLLVANVNYVTVLKNSGAGVFGSSAQYFKDSRFGGIFAADFDQDGDIDFASSPSEAGVISVFLNDGTGAYGTRTTYSTSGKPSTIVGGYFDDHYPVGMVTANGVGNSLTLLRGGIDGSFQNLMVFTGEYAIPQWGYAPAVGDFDNDGDADIAVLTNESMILLFNDGDANFELVDTGINVYGSGNSLGGSLESADVDGDGDIDVIHRYGGYAVLLNDGHGNFELNLRYSPVGNVVYPLVDMDGDSDPDLVTTGSQPDRIMIYRHGALHITSVEATGGNEILVNFSNEILDGATDPANYAISGPGRGALAEIPDSVLQLGPKSFRLEWNSGSVLLGEEITITVSPVLRSTDGNAMNYLNDSTDYDGFTPLSPTPSPSPSPSPTESPSPSPTESLTPSPTESATPSPSVSPSLTLSPTASPSVSPSDSPTASPTESATPSLTTSPSISLSMSPSPTESPSPSPTESLTPSPTESATPSPSVSPSLTLSPTASPSVSPSDSPTASPTESATPSLTESATPSFTASVSPSISASASATPSVSASPSLTASVTATASPSESVSPSPSESAGPTLSPSVSPSIIASPTASPLPTASLSPTASPSASATPVVVEPSTVIDVLLSQAAIPDPALLHAGDTDENGFWDAADLVGVAND
ncbi:VCBS repeat-containing protein [Candidatus Sumerlaeota bacterium]|nr:VCBS repeat-containing protein [Candidatus Sumerlaeota bacterium]